MSRRFRAASSAPATLLLCLLARPACAGDCWLPGVESKTTGFGDAITAPRHTAFRAVLQRASALLQADAVINGMPDVRYQQHLHLGESRHAGVARSGAVRVYLHQPDMWTGACGLKPGADTVHFAELQIALNDLSGIHSPGDGEFFPAPRRVGGHNGYPVYANAAGNRMLIMTASGASPFVAVTVGEYFDVWNRRLQREREEAQRNRQALAGDPEWADYIAGLRKTDPRAAAELQQELDEAAALAAAGDPAADAEWHELQRLHTTLTPAQRAQPVYLTADAMDRYRFAYAQPDAAGAVALVRLNPALWGGVHGESAVLVVALQVSIQDAESSRRVGADRWLERLDIDRYRGLLGEGRDDTAADADGAVAIDPCAGGAPAQPAGPGGRRQSRRVQFGNGRGRFGSATAAADIWDHPLADSVQHGARIPDDDRHHRQ